MHKAFEGANGWYVAWENADGFHRQPAFGGNMTQEQADREAQQLNTEPEDEDSES